MPSTLLDSKKTERLISRHEAHEASLQLHSQNSCSRSDVEIFIASTYRTFYSAQIREFLPLLLSLETRNRIQAAAGLRPAACGPLFLEQYLDCPIEQKVATTRRRPIDRDSIMEIGNLSATHGYSRLLFVLMAAALCESQYHWLVFTATPTVIKLISKLNYQPTFLENASPERIGESASVWGTYYQTHPRVMVVETQKAMTCLKNNPRITSLMDNYQDTIVTLASMFRDHRRLCGVEAQ